MLNLNSKYVYSRVCKFLFCLNVFIANTWAETPQNEASLIRPPVFETYLLQGSLVTGLVEKGRHLKLDSKEIAVDKHGRFVFGLGRDYPEKLKLTVTNGEITKTFIYSVMQRQYQTQSITGIDKKYVTPPKERLDRISNEAAMVRRARNIRSNKKFYLEAPILPAKGVITGVYGSQRIFNGVPKRPHFGLDFAAPIGTSIVAPLNGVVTLAYDDMYYSGGTLIIDHGDGVSSTFIHLNKIDVKEGQEVKQGEKIGEMGETGRATGPHLDWRINWYQERLDPALLFKKHPLIF